MYNRLQPMISGLSVSLDFGQNGIYMRDRSSENLYYTLHPVSGNLYYLYFFLSHRNGDREQYRVPGPRPQHSLSYTFPH